MRYQDRTTEEKAHYDTEMDPGPSNDIGTSPLARKIETVRRLRCRKGLPIRRYHVVRPLRMVKIVQRVGEHKESVSVEVNI